MAETLVLKSTLAGHSDAVTSIACSAGGAMVSSSLDGSLIQWSPSASAPLIRRLSGHGGSVRDVTLSCDGKFALSGSSDGEVRLWDLGNGETTKRFVGHADDVLSVAFSADNRQIFSASKDRTIKLWKTTGECIYTIESKFGHSKAVTCIRFSPNTQQLTFITGSEDSMLKVWNLINCRSRYILSGHQDCVNTVAISPDGSIFASGGQDGLTLIWNLAEGKKLFEVDTGAVVNSLCFCPDRHWLCVATEKSIQIWDVDDKLIVQELDDDKMAYCTCLCWSVDGNNLYAGYIDGTIKDWCFTCSY